MLLPFPMQVRCICTIINNQGIHGAAKGFAEVLQHDQVHTAQRASLHAVQGVSCRTPSGCPVETKSCPIVLCGDRRSSTCKEDCCEAEPAAVDQHTHLTRLQRQTSGPDVLSRSVDNLNLKALAAAQPPRSARVGSTYSATSSGKAASASAAGSAAKSTVSRQHKRVIGNQMQPT